MLAREAIWPPRPISCAARPTFMRIDFARPSPSSSKLTFSMMLPGGRPPRSWKREKSMSGWPNGAMPPRPMSGSAPGFPMILTFPRRTPASLPFANMNPPEVTRQAKFQDPDRPREVFFLGRNPLMHPDPSSIPAPDGKLARFWLALLLLLSLASTGLGQEADADPGSPGSRQPAAKASDREAVPGPEVRNLESEIVDLEALKQRAGNLFQSGLRWYLRTPAAERMSWGGLFACAGLGLAVLFERAVRLRRWKIIPADFTARFLDRLYEGKLDGGKALDYCEMNPSPAAHVALAAVRRWGRPAVDLERAVALTHRGEVERLRRNVGTLRRVAALAPLVGLLGTLLAVGRVLAAIPGAGAAAAPGIIASGSAAWGPALASALSPLILGLTIATLALVAYDSLVIRIERLSGALDRLGAETIDAIAMATQPAASPLIASPFSPRASRSDPEHPVGNPGPARTPHQVPSPRRRVDDAVTRNAPSEPDIGF